MPLHEYNCKKCGIFEVLQKINENSLCHCPTCHGPVEKIISVPARAIFRGHGFYETDYKSNKSKKE